MPTKEMELGDFTQLADAYSAYRSGYSTSARSAILGLLRRTASDIDAVDVGAGTGIWTRMLAEVGLRSVTAVEPNDAMRARGEEDSRGSGIVWRPGTGDDTGLPAGTADLVTMASSFHWVDFEAGTREFSRLLRPGGWFVALWNPRHIAASPLLADIEAHLTEINPSLERVSSGSVPSLASLGDKLWGHDRFDDVVIIEGRHVVRQTIDQYVGAWRSVNDVQAQLGSVGFERFLAYAAARIEASGGVVETTYLTRAWAARRAA